MAAPLALDTCVRLRNGVRMPIFGVGTSHNEGGTSTQALVDSIAAGVRHLDTAARYGSEGQVADAISQSKVPREELFVTTKLWPDDAGNVEAALRASLLRLRLQHVDLYLVHWPDLHDRRKVWAQMERVLEKGMCRAIGVSNFLQRHLLDLEGVRTPPMVNQVEYNPFQQPRELHRFCDERGIVMGGYCPLGKGRVLRDPALERVARGVGRTPAQVLLRWSLEKGVVTIPKCSSAAHIRENVDAFGFQLSAEDTRALDALDRNLRCTWDPTHVS
jgi:diketogulonate reductase-like aldo/keto reductase